MKETTVTIKRTSASRVLQMARANISHASANIGYDDDIACADLQAAAQELVSLIADIKRQGPANG